MKKLLTIVLAVVQTATAFAADKCDSVHDEMVRKIEVYEKHSGRLLELPEDCSPALVSTAKDVVDAFIAASSYVDQHEECALASVDVSIAHMKAASGYPKKLLETCKAK